MSKTIQTNPAYRDLAWSIYSTPGINYRAAASMFEGYELSGLLLLKVNHLDLLHE